MNKGRFSAGQAYVAMSRVTTMNGLFVVGVNPSKITVSKEVEEEMERLQRSTLKHTDSEVAHAEDNIPVCRLALLNVAGILNKKVDLESDAGIADCDVISLVETWLKPGNELSMFSKDHYAYRLDRHNVVGLENVERGGVIAYVKSNMKVKQLHNQEPNLEAIILEVEVCGSIFYIITAYRPPSFQITKFRDSIDRLLEYLPTGQIILVKRF